MIGLPVVGPVSTISLGEPAASALATDLHNVAPVISNSSVLSGGIHGEVRHQVTISLTVDNSGHILLLRYFIID